MAPIGSVPWFAARPLYLITDGGGLREEGKLVPSLKAVIAAAPQRISFIQLREQVTGSETTCSDEELAEITAELLPLCDDAGIGLLVNRNASFANSANLNGIHIGKPVDAIREEREVVGDKIIGYSAHSSDEAIVAFSYGADYVVLSPIYAPLSKVSKRPPIGVRALKELRRSEDKPVVALGGITAANAGECRKAGASGIAVISSVLGTTEPAQAACSLLAAWDR